ncbi:MAG: 4Fe-4S binding protein [Prevotellaceae bacterium]|jgi:NAD-dependent dihydropyrimidine dehydrogenase PreA subunit|nr:4Fe-4S binding protein [Prevotellaceae bacterium]
MLYYCIIGAVIALWLTGIVCRHIRGRRKMIRVIEDNCTGCTKCLKICRRNVLEAVKDENGTHIAVKNPYNCTACSNCVKACKFKALELYSLRNRKDD